MFTQKMVEEITKNILGNSCYELDYSEYNKNCAILEFTNNEKSNNIQFKIFYDSEGTIEVESFYFLEKNTFNKKDVEWLENYNVVNWRCRKTKLEFEAKIKYGLEIEISDEIEDSLVRFLMDILEKYL